MSDWDIWRKDVNSFDIDYELSRFNESNVKPYRETIKALKKIARISGLMWSRTHSWRRRILIPKENARQRAMSDGIFAALNEAIILFEDSDKIARDYYDTLKILSKKISMRRKELEIARENLDENNIKSIHKEMFLTIEISYLIMSWRQFLNQKDSFKES